MNNNKKKIIYIILTTVMLSFCIIDSFFGVNYFGAIYSFTIKPTMWIMLLIISLLLFRTEKQKDHKYKREIIFIMIILTLLYFLLYFLLGFAKGFAYNVYDRSLKSLLMNSYSILPYLISREYLRYFMIKNSLEKNGIRNMIIISIIFFVVDINLVTAFKLLGSDVLIFQLIIGTIIPKLTLSLFLSYIVYYSGSLINLLYVVFPQAIGLLLPFIPDIDWLLNGLLTTTVAFFGFLVINYRILKISRKLDNKKSVADSKFSWQIPLSVFGAATVLAVTLLLVKPVVIASNSMYPLIKKGDLVFIKDYKMTDLKKGDIIRYKIDSVQIVHRIERIETDLYNRTYYVMKGDNNTDIDVHPVRKENITGIYVGKIPYIGYPTLIINKLLGNAVDDPIVVETGNKG